MINKDKTLLKCLYGLQVIIAGTLLAHNILTQPKPAQYSITRTAGSTEVSEQHFFGSTRYWIDSGNKGSVDKKYLEIAIITRNGCSLKRIDEPITEQDNQLVQGLVAKLKEAK